MYEFPNKSTPILKMEFLQLFGELGFNCHFGNPDLIPNTHEQENSLAITIFVDSIEYSAFLLPCTIIIVSYGYIWFYMKKSHNYMMNLIGTKFVFFLYFSFNLIIFILTFKIYTF